MSLHTTLEAHHPSHCGSSSIFSCFVAFEIRLTTIQSRLSLSAVLMPYPSLSRPPTSSKSLNPLLRDSQRDKIRPPAYPKSHLQLLMPYHTVSRWVWTCAHCIRGISEHAAADAARITFLGKGLKKWTAQFDRRFSWCGV